MNSTDQRYNTYLAILKRELIPAMGCTEPVALAYCSAKARAFLGQIPRRVDIELSGNIIKNVKSVIVPNTGGEKGIETAAAIGIIAGDENMGLEVLSHVTQLEKEALVPYREQTEFNVKSSDSGLLLDIFVRVWAGDESAAVRIANEHTNIVYIEKNGNILLDQRVSAEDVTSDLDYTMLTVAGILDFAQTVDLNLVQPLLERQVVYNNAISEDGLHAK